jgi:hypothetical protein
MLVIVGHSAVLVFAFVVSRVNIAPNHICGRRQRKSQIGLR